MGENSKIEWTHHTFSPWWGCEKVSDGCKHCYADTFSRRVGHGARLPKLWGPGSVRRTFGDKHWAEPLKWNRDAEKAGERRRVFCASMADVFEDRPELVLPRVRLRHLIEATPWLDWLLLTKRIENADRLWRQASLLAWDGGALDAPTWGSNVWLGTTVEDQKRANERIPRLLKVPAAVRFLSCEPLLEAVDLTNVVEDIHGLRVDGVPVRFIRDALRPSALAYGSPEENGVDWVIVGGESGGGARPFGLDWARSVVKQCRDAGVPVLVKQFGAVPESSDDDDRRHVGDMNLPRRFRLKLADRKGGDWGEWPEDLRVREYPTTSMFGKVRT